MKISFCGFSGGLYYHLLTYIKSDTVQKEKEGSRECRKKT